ncbi:MAG: hypothetical protein Tsb0020_45020 [Haliangiales bacterium]
MKLSRGAADLLAQHAWRQNRPVTVTFQVTDRCNYECVHCYQEHRAEDELSLAEVDRVLVELADAGVLFLTLMGGEFFMRPDADDILRRAHELGFALKLLTTGHHIHERRADLIAAMRPIQVDMSMYGPDGHIHDQVTRQEGSWRRTYEAAKRLIERRVPVLLKAPVMEANVAELAGLAALARELGAESSFDAKLTGREDTDQAPVGLRMRAATLRAFYRDEDSGMAEFLTKTYAASNNAGDASGADQPGAETELRPLHHTPCRAGQQAVAINPRGEVWPCNALPIACGDLRQQSFADIWRGSEQLAEIRQLRWAALAECNVCQLRRYCQRCHGMALLEQGQLRGPSLEACRHAVAVRDALRDQGIVPATDTALPPTWDRVDPDGQHHLRAAAPASPTTDPSDSNATPRGQRSSALRILP